MAAYVSKKKDIEVHEGFLLTNDDQAGFSQGLAVKATYDEASKFLNPAAAQFLGGFFRMSLNQLVPGGMYEFGSGTVTAPGIRWAADTNTGFYLVAAGQIGISINGVNEATFNSSGLQIANLTQYRVVVVGGVGQLVDYAGLTFDNASNTLTILNSSASTDPQLILSQGSGGDTALRWVQGTAHSFIAGIDNTTDIFTMSYAASATAVLGTNDLFTLSTTGVATFTGAIKTAATSNQIVLQSAGVTGTITWTPATTNKTLTIPNETGTVELSEHKDAASGYAGLNASSRITKGVDTTDDLIVDLATKGLVLKDTQGTPHYWRVTVSTIGVLTTADLGTTKP